MALKDTLNDVVTTAKDLIRDATPGHEAEPETEADVAKAEQAHEDALEILREDHRRVEALFKEILSETSSALTSQRKNIAAVLDALALHTKIEESIFYPAVYGKTKRDTDDRMNVLESVEEHASMKDLMKKIARTTGRDETLKAKVQVLSEITEHHVREEESTFFPEAKKLLGEKRLREIGAEILKVKERAARGSARGAKRPSAKKTRATSKASASKTPSRKKRAARD